MVQIGTIEYEARVSNVDEAQANANDFADSHRDVGEAAEGASSSVGLLAGSFGFAAAGANQAGDEADEADTEFTLLRGTVGGVTRAFGRFFRMLAGGTILTTISGLASKLVTVLGGLSLSGILGSVTGAISSFVGWLAAGSAGALAFAGAIGAAIGLFGVWILEITGVLDWIGSLGQMLSVELPGWARDGLLAVIGLFTGPLAVIGGFIVGFIEGGFSEAFDRAGQVIDIFFGAFARTFGRIGSIVDRTVRTIMGMFAQAKNWVVSQLRAIGNFALGIWSGIESGVSGALSGVTGFFTDLKNDATGAIDEVLTSAQDLPGDIAGIFTDLGDSFSGAFADTFNAVIPNEVGLDPVTLPTVTVDAGPLGSATVGGQTVFGGVTFDMPRLQMGGTVARTGVAEVHEGEVVGQPGALLEAAGMGTTGGGGGGTSVEVDTIHIELDGDFDPSDVSRRDLDSLADRLVDLIGDKTNRRAGVR